MAELFSAGEVMLYWVGGFQQQREGEDRRKSALGEGAAGRERSLAFRSNPSRALKLSLLGKLVHTSKVEGWVGGYFPPSLMSHDQLYPIQVLLLVIVEHRVIVERACPIGGACHVWR